MTPSKGFLIGLTAVVVIGLGATAFLYNVYLRIPDPDWKLINKEIDKDFPGIPKTTTEELAEAMGGVSPPVIIDCRAASEFSVSHLPGAVDASSVDEVKTVAAPDAEIVVYCSVGYRSGKLVSELQAAGFKGAKNLEGSIFAWANEDRPLVREGGDEVKTVHPFSKRWGKLLDREKRHPID